MAPMFHTAQGIEVPAVTETQMRELDRVAIEETGSNLFQMMENAGRNLALQSMEMLGGNWRQARIVVLAGTSGNGGGGICAARHLANRCANIGLTITESDRLNTVAAWQLRVFSSTPGEIVRLHRLSDKKTDLVVDALIGYSLHDAPHGKVGDLIQWANGSGALVLALDIPSGIDSTTGQTPGFYVGADLTMTLAIPKIGLSNPAAGELVLGNAIDGLGNIYVVGPSDDGSYRDFRTIKYAWDGTIEFNVTFDGGGDDYVSGIALDVFGSVYVAGESYQGGDYDACVIKYDDQGNEVWTMVTDLGGIDRAQDIAVDADGFLHIVGEKGDSWDADLFLMTANTYGDTAWTRTYDTGFNDWGASVALDGWGYGYIMGNIDADTLATFRVMKYDWRGDIVWTAVFSSESDEIGEDIAVDYDGNVYVVGLFSVRNRQDIRVTKYNTNGTQLWTRVFDGGVYERALGVTTDGAGSVIVSGSTSDEKDAKFLLLKYTSTGDLLWALVGDSEDSTEGFDVKVDQDGFLYVAATADNGTDHDFSTRIYQQYLTIDGRVVDERSGVEGVVVRLEGYFDLADTTDADGYFEFVDLPCAHRYRVYPDMAGAVFDPPEYEYLTLGYDYTDQDFEVTLGSTPPELTNQVTLSIENPVSNVAVIEYSLPVDSEIRLNILDLTGRIIETILANKQSRGSHHISWTPESSGVFLARLETRVGSLTRRIVVVR